MNHPLTLFKSALIQGGIDFKYKQITGTFAMFDMEVNIQAIFSFDEGKGNCQEFIKVWQKVLKELGLELVSSTPINPAWRHICEKLKIKIYE